MWIGNNWLDGDKAPPFKVWRAVAILAAITSAGFIAGATFHLWS